MVGGGTSQGGNVVTERLNLMELDYNSRYPSPQSHWVHLEATYTYQ